MSNTPPNIESPPLAKCFVRRVSATYPYYTPLAANVVRPIALDMMATASTDQRARSIEAAKMKKSLATLEKIISRGAMYLVDHDTTEGKIFREWRRNVFIKKHYPTQCVLIEWKFGGLEVTLVDGEPRPPSKPISAPTSKQALIQDATVTMQWQEGIDNFLNEGLTGQRLEISDLKLTPDDMVNVRRSLLGMEDIVKVIEISSGKVILEK